ncbi:protein csh3 [Rhypophila decipiens]|uniref:Protein csh3 n=1 Tax=Rhypophila decipiens TaxID=261697 RepID=A0AAN6YGC4_9PEZI|nr:protein csh3 [Rhypophila decipiens]
MVSEDRQRIIEANRSLRNIKNELEALLEKGMITEDAFDSINNLLPTESSISGSSRRAIPPTPGATRAPPVSAGIANKLNNLHLDEHHATDNAPPPPSYSQSTNGGPPPLPGRKQAAPPPPPPPSKPIIAHAKALYPYAATDSRDCSFERDDRLAVYEYMNADWWMGKNLRTGQEGIFPKAYVEQEQAGWNEKAGQGYNQNPYNSHVPPQTMANTSYGHNNNNGGGEQGESKVEGTGKKIGKKLGNAAIFGAGATIGSNIVNSIF